MQVRVAAARAIGACFASKVHCGHNISIVRSVTKRQAPEEFSTTALAAAGVELKDMAKVNVGLWWSQP